MPNNSFRRLIAFITCIIAWIGMIIQYYVAIKSGPNHNLSFLESNTRFWGYFTVLTNFLCAICLTSVLFFRGSWHRFFSKFSTQTAITVYILIVGLGYNVLLRHLYTFNGAHAISNEIQHVVVPGLFTIYWFFLPKKALKWKLVFLWLLYPFVYLVMALTRGSIDGFYPYPFLNANEISFSEVIKNAAGLMVAFVLVSLVFIAVSGRK
jgi:hypothetical protein